MPWYIVGQLIGAAVGGLAIFAIANGVDGFDSTNNFAQNGWGDFSPGGYDLMATAVAEVIFTAVLVFTVLATLVYWLVGRFSRQPITLYRRLSVAALFITFIPDLGLLVAGFPGVTVPAVLALMVMHIFSALIIVATLTTLARE